MRVLALDTTTRAGSVAVLDGTSLRGCRVGDPGRSQAERLPQEVLDLLTAAGMDTGDVELFAVASGPGLFTGLRIGIATIQGLALVTGRHVAPVSALRALATCAAEGREAGTIVAGWMNAHRHDVFSAVYRVGPRAGDGTATLIEIEAPTVEAPAATVERWRLRGVVPTLVCGDGARLYASDLPVGVDAIEPPPLAPIIARLAVADAAAGLTVPPADVTPLYVRRPDAEVARDAARHR